jgi:hypothetical protein
MWGDRSRAWLYVPSLGEAFLSRDESRLVRADQTLAFVENLRDHCSLWISGNDQANRVSPPSPKAVKWPGLDSGQARLPK